MTTFDPMTATNGDLWEIIDALRDMAELGDAWKEAEAALPEGWWFDVFSLALPGWWEVVARAETELSGGKGISVEAEGIAAALRALAAKLRTPQPDFDPHAKWTETEWASADSKEPES